MSEPGIPMVVFVYPVEEIVPGVNSKLEEGAFGCSQTIIPPSVEPGQSDNHHSLSC